MRHRAGLWQGRATLVLALVMACGVKRLDRRLVEPAQAATLDHRSPFLKAHLRNGSVYVLEHWQVDSAGAMISGQGTLYDASRIAISTGPVSFPTDSVALFETNVVRTSGQNAAITVMAGITAAVAGICLASPKTCFGSCPTFYVDDGTGPYLHAEGFSASIAPALEATDVDALARARPRGRDFTVRLTNEAFETHVIRYVDLLAAPRPAGGDVAQAIDGRFLGFVEARPATSCSAPEGDCREALAAFDRRERASLADSTDLATRETITLTFDRPPPGPLGLVVTSRQSLMSTFLLYQTLAWMGNEATSILAGLRATTGGPGLDITARLGRVDVQVPDSAGGWTTAGSVGETGPLAPDTRLVPLPSGVRDGPVVVRLSLTRGMWRLDQARLVRLAEEIPTVRLSPRAVTHEGRPDTTTLAALIDPARSLVTFPGDAYELHYRLPPHPERYALFLETRGYYLEWMRQEWLAEENPMLAAAVLLDPAGTLRALAPAYKAEEPRLETLFWNSRYVRR
jgi:hypothetical protein